VTFVQSLRYALLPRAVYYLVRHGSKVATVIVIETISGIGYRLRDEAAER